MRSKKVASSITEIFVARAEATCEKIVDFIRVSLVWRFVLDFLCLGQHPIVRRAV